MLDTYGSVSLSIGTPVLGFIGRRHHRKINAIKMSADMVNMAAEGSLKLRRWTGAEPPE